MYPKAVTIAERLFRAALSRRRSRGRVVLPSTREWQALKKKYVPPYKVTRFVNKYRKMAADEPSRTVPAHLGKDCYSHIHPDSEQARTISLREAARLQSFPDGFLLTGSLNDRYTQIGNAVPPLMAYAIARNLRQQLGSAARRQSRRAPRGDEA